MADPTLLIVLPILTVLLLSAVSSGILYAFFRHFKKNTTTPTENNQQVVAVCVRTNKLTVSMQCWRRLFQPVIFLFYCMFGPSFFSRLLIIYALRVSYTSLSEQSTVFHEIKIWAKHSLLGQYSHCANVRLLVTVFERFLVGFSVSSFANRSPPQRKNIVRTPIYSSLKIQSIF
jgi:hypothetical protein